MSADSPAPPPPDLRVAGSRVGVKGFSRENVAYSKNEAGGREDVRVAGKDVGVDMVPEVIGRSLLRQNFMTGGPDETQSARKRGQTYAAGRSPV